MNKEKVILGLDIGVGSIGWSLVKIREEEYSDEKPEGTIEKKHRIIGGEIIGTGVRTFQIPQDRQKKSLALIRGSARRSRWTTRRKAHRLKRLIQLVKEFKLIEDFDRDAIFKPKQGDNESNWDIWTIRKEALERKLTDVELFRVLYHIAKHRGFYFHTKAEEIQEEDKKSEAGRKKAKVKEGLWRIRSKLEKGHWKTVGQMFCEEYKQTGKENKRKRNAENKYGKSIHRSLLKEEIEKIFKEQQKMGNSKAKKELKNRYIDEILMKEEGIDDEKLQKMMKGCEFVPGAKCAPKESYTAERFTLFSRLNTLAMVDTKNKDKRLALDDEQRGKIQRLSYEKAKVTFAQIRSELGLQDDLGLRFNLCSYKEKDPEYNKKLICEIRKGRLRFGERHRVRIVDINTGEVKVLDEEIQSIFKSKELWPNSKNMRIYYSDIRKQLNLSGDFRFADLKGYTKSEAELGSKAKYIKQFEDDTFVEVKGYHKIKNAIERHCGDNRWAKLAEDENKLDIIAEALVYHKSDETRTKYLKENGVVDEDVINAILKINMKELANHSKEALSNVLKYMGSKDRMLFNDAKKKCGYGRADYDKQAILQPYSGFFENNPAVARVISQTRKLINAILRKYKDNHPIDQIHIELATELANSEKRKSQISEGQRRYKEAKEAATERCREFDLDPEEGQNLLMFRLAEEQRQLCPYSGKHITFKPSGASNEVYIQDCEIDHIIPMSRSFNDSLNNKVLCTQKANQDKRDRIPFEWFEDIYGKESEQWRDFENTVKKMYGMPYPKRKNLLKKSWTEKDKERFLSRNLNDTRYAARHIADYLRKYFDFSLSEREDIKEVSRVKVRSGNITAFLRYIWGLHKDREENDLHHALDALVVACSTDGHVYLVSNLSKEIERKGKNWFKHFNFLRDRFKPWSSIRDDIQEAVNNIFVSRMPRHTVTGAGHEETIISGEGRDKNRTIEVRGGYAKMGDMVRADVFVDEAGKNYVVPIYSVDIFSKKPLPDKYIEKADAPYDEWPSVKDDKLEFRFSLFKDDLISIDGQMYYIDHIRGTRPLIRVKNIDGSVFESNNKERELGYRNVRLKKYSVDILGRYKEVKQEKRLGGRFNR